MRLTLTLLGLELDITLGRADAASPAPDNEVLSGGTTASTAVGFTPWFEQPDEMPLPMRNNGWGDEGNRL